MISEEDKIKIRKFEQILKKGLYCSGTELQEVYNRVLNANLSPTNCGSCLRLRTQQLVNALNKYEASEALKNVDPITTPSEENKASDEPKNGENKPKRVGRTKRK